MIYSLIISLIVFDSKKETKVYHMTEVFYDPIYISYGVGRCQLVLRVTIHEWLCRATRLAAMID